MQINTHTLSQVSEVAEHNDGTHVNAKPFIPNTDFDQQSIYSTSSSLTVSSPSPSLTVSPNYNIANDLTFTNQLTHTINTTNNNIFTQLKIYIAMNTATDNNIYKQNLSKKSIYIAREMIEFINTFCFESFHTYQKNDMGLLFSYIKESNAMQINDKQINIHNTFSGKIIIINIDLYFKNGQTMYLIGMLNELKYIQKIPWKIVTIMSNNTIFKSFGITKNKLPKSSRNMRQFIDGLALSPEYVYVPANVIWKTNFKKLSEKNSKNINKNDLNVVDITEYDLKCYCESSWNNKLCVPVVWNNCIEWKQFVRIFDDENCNEQWIGISLRYHKTNKEWKITCIDYNFGRLFYQFKLVGNNHGYKYCYDDLSGLVNTTLNIL
eukprot:852731_1